ncbi:hypothetical protein DFJ73DRAFT_895451 [Zopfochytrium polystomum]|nr:hypothetical protein DFJ73DRAFT_895451 [Zopfochytrium polystomum]
MPQQPPSLRELCTRKLERNVDRIGSLDTQFGPVPFHLLRPIVARASFHQLESIVEWNPDRTDIVEEGNADLWKSFALREFGSVRDMVSQPDFSPPPCWRQFYIDLKKQQEDRMEAMKRRLTAQKEEMERKARKQVVVLDKPLNLRKSSSSWGGGDTYAAKKENKFFKAARKELAKKRPFDDSLLITRPPLSGSLLSRTTKITTTTTPIRPGDAARTPPVPPRLPTGPLPPASRPPPPPPPPVASSRAAPPSLPSAGSGLVVRKRDGAWSNGLGRAK